MCYCHSRRHCYNRSCYTKDQKLQFIILQLKTDIFIYGIRTFCQMLSATGVRMTWRYRGVPRRSHRREDDLEPGATAACQGAPTGARTTWRYGSVPRRSYRREDDLEAGATAAAQPPPTGARTTWSPELRQRRSHQHENDLEPIATAAS
jgi:hypothetical protein